MNDFVLYVILRDMVFLKVCLIFLSYFLPVGSGSASGFVAIWTILGFWLWIRIRMKTYADPILCYQWKFNCN